MKGSQESSIVISMEDLKSDTDSVIIGRHPTKRAIMKGSQECRIVISKI